MATTRRGFLKGTAWFGAAAVTGGCNVVEHPRVERLEEAQVVHAHPSGPVPGGFQGAVHHGTEAQDRDRVAFQQGFRTADLVRFRRGLPPFQC